MLIYEKRQEGETKTDRGTVSSEKAATENVSCDMANDMDVRRETVSCKRLRKGGKSFFVKKRKSMHMLKRAAVVATAVCVFCLADVKLFGGTAAESIAIAVKNAAGTVAEKETAEKTDLGMRTLYTLDYSENPQKYDFDVLYKNEDVPVTEAPVPVNSAVGQAYIDGVKFYPITALDLSSEDPYVLNDGAGLSPDMTAVDKRTSPSLVGLTRSKEPLVLILHTHACESYTEYEGMYPANELTRNEDAEKNVVRVGREIAQTLSDFGVPAVHCTKLHDKESFITAYSNSAASVKEYLKKYPSIRFVIDVHRDAVIKDDGESIKAVTEIAGENYAQLMFVVGTNALGHNHPDWQDNLSLALDLQKSVQDTYPSLCRNINLRDVPFNQQLSSGYLLLEVGTCANTLDEALNSARAFGENLARVIDGAM